MIEWVVSSSVLILLIITMRFLFRNRLALWARYALWLLAALRLLVPFSFFTSSISILNLLEAGEAVLERIIPLSGQADSGTGETVKPEDGGTPASGNSQALLRFGNDGAGEWGTAGNRATTNGGNREAPGGGTGESVGGGETSADMPGGGMWADGEDSGNGEVKNGGAAGGGGMPDTRSGYGRGGGTGRLLAAVWLSGAVLCAGVTAAGNFIYRRRLHRSRIHCGMHTDSRLSVYTSPVVSSPCLFGLLHPAVYLTIGAAGFRAAELGTLDEREALGYVLSHEDTHYRHRDNLWVLVRAACICVHWYNPLVWLAARLSRQDCELACDEAVLAKLGERERVRYGRALLAFSVRDNEVFGTLRSAATISGGKKQLKERLMVIVQKPRRSSLALVWTVVLALAVSAVTFTGKTDVLASGGGDREDGAVSGSDGGKESAGNAEETPLAETYVRELAFDLGDGREYILQISGSTVPGTGEYHAGQIVFFRDDGGDRELLQTIPEGEAKVLYTRPAGDAEPFSDSRGSSPWIFSSGQDALFAKPLCTREELPADAEKAFREGDGGEMWAYAPDGGIMIADLNFDGYNDFCVQGGIGSVNVPYYCYLWNGGGFEPGYMIPNVQVNQETGLIESLTKDGDGLYSIKYYWFDEENTLHLVRYVEENQSPDAVFPVLDLTYDEDGYYTLPAVDEWDYLAEYGGALAERLVYWARQALTELYAWSGTRIDKACFSTSDFGSFSFSNTPEDARSGRVFYTRTYGARAGFVDCIESMWVCTDKMVWYSGVKQWNMPDDFRNMTDIQLVEWYFGLSALTRGERAAEIEESYEDNYVVRAESGRFYELTLDPATREVTSVYGPYDSYPVH